MFEADPTLPRCGTDLVQVWMFEADPTLPRCGTDLVQVWIL